MKNECFRSTDEADFTFSQCSFRNEFTCDDGSCINKYKRCDDINDCDDASDENNCTIVKLEEDYRRGDPPKLSNNEINYLETTVEIKRIDSIDLNGIMTLTASITIRWRDPRMEFLNIRDKEFSSGDTDNVKVTKSVKKFILEFFMRRRFHHPSALVCGFLSTRLCTRTPSSARSRTGTTTTSVSSLGHPSSMETREPRLKAS